MIGASLVIKGRKGRRDPLRRGGWGERGPPTRGKGQHKREGGGLRETREVEGDLGYHYRVYAYYPRNKP